MIGVFQFALIAIVLVVLVFSVIGRWKTYEKAGKPGWAAIVPIYSTIVLVQLSGKEMWHAALILLGGLIPGIGGLASLAGSIIVGMAVAEKFNKSQTFGVVALGIFGFVGYPILGFGDAQYEGAEVVETNDEILDI